MDIRSYFSVASGSKPPALSSSCNSHSDSDSDSCEPNPPKAKKHCSSPGLSWPKHLSKSGSEIRRYNERWESTYPRSSVIVTWKKWLKCGTGRQRR